MENDGGRRRRDPYDKRGGEKDERRGWVTGEHLLPCPLIAAAAQ